MRRLENAGGGGSQIKYGVLMSYAAIGISILLTLLYTPWMIQKIGQQNYGLYALATSLITMIAFDFGIGDAVTRYLSKYRAEHDSTAAGGFMGVVFRLFFLIDGILFVVFIALFFCLNAIYRGLTAEELLIFKKLYLIVAFYTLVTFPALPLNGTLYAYEEFVWAKALDLTHRLLTVLMVVLLLLYGFGVIAVVMANAISGITVMALRIWIVKRKTGLAVDFRADGRALYREIFAFSIWTAVLSFSISLTYSFAPSIFAITLNSTAVAQFSPASSLGSYFSTIGAAISGLFLPTVSRYLAEGRMGELTELMIRVGRYQMSVLGFVFAGFLSVGDLFIRLWLGEGFEPSYVCAAAMMLSLLLRCPQEVGRASIIAGGYVKILGRYYIAAALSGALLNFLLSKMWGLMGGLLALMLTDFLFVLGIDYVSGKEVSMDIAAYYRKGVLPMLPPILAVVLIGRFFLTRIGTQSWIWLLLKIGMVSVLYFFLLWFISLNREEKKQIEKRVRKSP